MKRHLLKLALTMVGAVFLGAPAYTWLFLGGEVSDLTRYDTLPGQLPYVISKLAALYAFELLWLQVMLGLLRQHISAWLNLNSVRWRRVHATLGASAFVLIAAHIALFVVATSMRNNAPAQDLLLPWGHGVYRTWVAFGAAGFWLICLAICAQLFRRNLQRARSWIHRAAIPAVFAILIHSLRIGSESQFSVMFGIYAAMTALLIAAVLLEYFPDKYAWRLRNRAMLRNQPGH